MMFTDLIVFLAVTMFGGYSWMLALSANNVQTLMNLAIMAVVTLALWLLGVHPVVLIIEFSLAGFLALNSALNEPMLVSLKRVIPTFGGKPAPAAPTQQ